MKKMNKKGVQADAPLPNSNGYCETNDQERLNILNSDWNWTILKFESEALKWGHTIFVSHRRLYSQTGRIGSYAWKQVSCVAAWVYILSVITEFCFFHASYRSAYFVLYKQLGKLRWGK